MKKVYHGDELPHIWIYNTQLEGYNSSRNVSFHGDKYYSYSTVIARRMGDAIVMSTRTYSSTTQRQQSKLKQAARGREVVYCNDVNNTPADNFERLKRDVIILADKQTRAKKVDYIAQADAQIEEFKKYAAVMGYKMPASTVAGICEYGATEVKRAEVARKKAIAAQKRAADKFKKSINFETADRVYSVTAKLFHAKKMSLYRHYKLMMQQFLRQCQEHKVTPPHNYFMDFLRIAPDGVITSQGVNITTEEARGLFLALKRGADIVGHKIGHYSINEINGEMLRVGCHTIARTEISYISQKLFSEAV